MKYLLTTLLLCLQFCLISNAQQFKWVKGGGTSQDLSTAPGAPEVEQVKFMTTDQNGNIYAATVVGNYPITADTFHRSSAYGANGSVLLVSYNCSGTMRWAKLIGSNSAAVTALGLTVDSLGHVYLCGIFPHGYLYIGYDTIIPNAGTNYQWASLMQFDTSGEFNWCRFVGTNVASNATSSGQGIGTVAVDKDQNVHYIKLFKAGCQITSSVMSVYGTYDLKYDPSGTLLGAQKLELDSFVTVYGAVFSRHSDKLYAYLDYTALTGSTRNAIAAFDQNRNVIWRDSLINTHDPGMVYFTGIQIDDYGHLYTTGGGPGCAIYRTDTVLNSLSSIDYSISFIMKMDTTGNGLWMRGYSATADINFLNALCLLPNNKIAAMGGMLGKIRGGSDSIISYSGEGWNCWLTVVDSGGHVDDMQQIHGVGTQDQGLAITADKSGSIYVGGRCATNVWAGTLSPYTSVGGEGDFFVMKYGVDCSCTPSSVPTANFSYTGTHTVSFTYTGTTASMDSIRWYFDDGGTSTSINPTHTFTAIGTYHVRVKVYTPCGSDSRWGDVVITCPYSLSASFTETGVTTHNFSYTGSTSGVDSVRWYFGDGGTSMLTSPTHTYTSIGSFMVCVYVHTWCASDTFCTTVVVPCLSAPTASATVSGSGGTRSFTYTGTAPTTTISWNFGDGSPTVTGTSVSHPYPAVGVYTACVTATNACGTSTACYTVNITCLTAPTSSYTFAGGFATKNFTFTGTTVGTDSVGWDFGDGIRTTGLTPSHTFASIGTFHVCARAYSNCGNDTSCIDISVPCLAAPVAAFTHTASSDSTGHFNYTASTAGIDSFRWSYGDGGTGIGSTASHHYGTTGVYTVCVIAYSQCGNDTLCDTIKIFHSVGVPNIKMTDDISVYPNPATNTVEVHNAMGYTIVLEDIIGRRFSELFAKNTVEKIDISGLVPGIYMVRSFDSSGRSKTFRIVKQ